ncbi:MAG: prepilin-type N-terminal cleavage/methylation domain-containing protein [Pyrinomonadaceae bacterium]|nr:prepilin-type N-terminal cleavage/methylation domain-containing protein [Pyrinomonadaceae bacterium]
MENRPKIIVAKALSHKNGFSVTELLIVVLVIAIVLVAALPQIISSQRLFRFSTIKRETTTYLREARQTAMAERKVITFRYDNSAKRIMIYGGSFGSAGDPNNKTLELAGMGLSQADIVYGRPTGVSTAALGDGTDLTSLTSNQVEVEFEPDGSVLDASDNPEDSALFLYHALHPQDTAFALSVLGSGGRIKVWRYSAGVDSYIE